MLCFVTVLGIEYRGFRKRKNEYRELEHFAEFLSNLKDQFYLCKNITESIFRAAEQMPGSLRKRLEEICFWLEEDTAETTFAEERFSGHLTYVRLFCIQCRSAVRYGSGKKGTESVFVKNMTELRRDVQNDCYQRMQSMYLFSGMGIITVLPVVFLPMIRVFGKVTMEELQAFYEGKTGRWIVLLFGMLTVGCYLILYMVRQTDRRGYQKPKVFKCLERIGEWHSGDGSSKGNRPKRWGAKKLEAAGIEADGNVYWIICGIIGIGTTCIVQISGMEGNVAEQIAVTLGSMLIGNGIGMAIFAYLEYLRKLGAEGEVLGMQAMILLLMDVPCITITEILDMLGDCGDLFRKRIRRCMDEYAAEDEVALKRMFEDAEHPLFRQFAGRILASSRIGIKAAFAEIASDRHFFREQLQMNMEQERKKKVANAQVIAFFPMMFLLFAYLIIPFLYISLEQMKEIFTEMEQIRFF